MGTTTSLLLYKEIRRHQRSLLLLYFLYSQRSAQLLMFLVSFSFHSFPIASPTSCWSPAPLLSSNHEFFNCQRELFNKLSHHSSKSTCSSKLVISFSCWYNLLASLFLSLKNPSSYWGSICVFHCFLCLFLSSPLHCYPPTPTNPCSLDSESLRCSLKIYFTKWIHLVCFIWYGVIHP